MKQLNFFLITSLLSVSATLAHAADTTTTTTSTPTANQSANLSTIMDDLATAKNKKSTTLEEQETAIAASMKG